MEEEIELQVISSDIEGMIALQTNFHWLPVLGNLLWYSLDYWGEFKAKELNEILIKKVGIKMKDVGSVRRQTYFSDLNYILSKKDFYPKIRVYKTTKYDMSESCRKQMESKIIGGVYAIKGKKDTLFRLATGEDKMFKESKVDVSVNLDINSSVYEGSFRETNEGLSHPLKEILKGFDRIKKNSTELVKIADEEIREKNIKLIESEYNYIKFKAEMKTAELLCVIHSYVKHPYCDTENLREKIRYVLNQLPDMVEDTSKIKDMMYFWYGEGMSRIGMDMDKITLGNQSYNKFKREMSLVFLGPEETFTPDEYKDYIMLVKEIADNYDEAGRIIEKELNKPGEFKPPIEFYKKMLKLNKLRIKVIEKTCPFAKLDWRKVLKLEVFESIIHLIPDEMRKFEEKTGEPHSLKEKYKTSVSVCLSNLKNYVDVVKEMENPPPEGFIGDKEMYKGLVLDKYNKEMMGVMKRFSRKDYTGSFIYDLLRQREYLLNNQPNVKRNKLYKEIIKIKEDRNSNSNDMQVLVVNMLFNADYIYGDLLELFSQLLENKNDYNKFQTKVIKNVNRMNKRFLIIDGLDEPLSEVKGKIDHQVNDWLKEELAVVSSSIFPYRSYGGHIIEPLTEINFTEGQQGLKFSYRNEEKKEKIMPRTFKSLRADKRTAEEYVDSIDFGKATTEIHEIVQNYYNKMLAASTEEFERGEKNKVEVIKEINYIKTFKEVLTGPTQLSWKLPEVKNKFYSVKGESGKRKPIEYKKFEPMKELVRHQGGIEVNPRYKLKLPKKMKSNRIKNPGNEHLVEKREWCEVFRDKNNFNVLQKFEEDLDYLYQNVTTDNTITRVIQDIPYLKKASKVKNQKIKEVEDTVKWILDPQEKAADIKEISMKANKGVKKYTIHNVEYVLKKLITSAIVNVHRSGKGVRHTGIKVSQWRYSTTNMRRIVANYCEYSKEHFKFFSNKKEDEVKRKWFTIRR